MEDQKIHILKIHMVKKAFNITKTRKNSLTITKNIPKFNKKKDTHQTFNAVAFPKQGCSFYIVKYHAV